LRTSVSAASERAFHHHLAREPQRRLLSGIEAGGAVVAFVQCRDLRFRAAEVARDRDVLDPFVFAAFELDRVQQAQLPELGVELELAQQRAAELHDRLHATLRMRHHVEDVGRRRQAPSISRTSGLALSRSG
jgi:hypothetical protein